MSGGRRIAPARNGYRTGHLQTAEGVVPYSVPQVRDVDAGPIAAIRERLHGRTEALKQLALELRLTIGTELVQSQVIRSQDEIATVTMNWRDAMIAKGWA